MTSVSKAKVYLVGAGPGDEGLITVRGLKLIGQADCIIYDYLVNADLLKSRKDGSKLIYVGKKAGEHTLSQDGINKLLVKEAKGNKCIVRLKGGDPFIFGRGAEEALYLKENNIDFEIVPGVTSAIAVPSYAGIPLTERSRTSTVGFITGHEDPSKEDSDIDWKSISKALGTMVFLMGVGNLDMIAKKLIAAGKPKDTPVAVIRRGTTAEQKTVTGTLENIAQKSLKEKMSPPAIIVVGQTVDLRKELRWFEKRPLFGKRIVVTRTREQASALSSKLKDLGAEAVELPTIKIVSLEADEELNKEFCSMRRDWIFFTSQNGVNEFRDFLKRSGKDCRLLGGAKICAIGPETAKSLNAIGIKADHVPARFIAEEIVKHFKAAKFKSVPAPRALILRAKKARDILPDGLKEAGFNVKVIDIYDTVMPEESAASLREALGKGVDAITFTSSSTVENFIRLAGRDYRRKLSGIKLASIGPITSCALTKSGLKADIEAEEYTIDGLVAALCGGIGL